MPVHLPVPGSTDDCSFSVFFFFSSFLWRARNAALAEALLLDDRRLRTHGPTRGSHQQSHITANAERRYMHYCLGGPCPQSAAWRSDRTGVEARSIDHPRHACFSHTPTSRFKPLTAVQGSLFFCYCLTPGRILSRKSSCPFLHDEHSGHVPGRA